MESILKQKTKNLKFFENTIINNSLIPLNENKVYLYSLLDRNKNESVDNIDNYIKNDVENIKELDNNNYYFVIENTWNHNFHHCLNETVLLMDIYMKYFNEFPNIKILLKKQEYSSFYQKFIDMLPETKIVYVDEEKLIKGNFIYILPYDAYHKSIEKVKETFLINNRPMLTEIINKANKCYDSNTIKKIYISRRNIFNKSWHNRYLTNIEEISNNIIKRGYTEIFTDEIEDFLYQVYLINNADEIILELGAGCDNIVFMKEGSIMTIIGNNTKESHSWIKRFYIYNNKVKIQEKLFGETDKTSKNYSDDIVNKYNLPYRINKNLLDSNNNVTVDGYNHQSINNLNDIQQFVLPIHYGLIYSTVEFNQDYLLIDNLKFNLKQVNFTDFYSKLQSNNFKFKMHTLRDIILPLYENFQYNKINEIIENYCKEFNKFEKFDKINYAFYEHSISWRTILFIFLLNSKILTNNNENNVNMHLQMLWYNFLQNNKNYKNNNHGLYEDLACMFYCKQYELNNSIYTNRFQSNFESNVVIGEGLCKEHSTNYHRLYKNIADIFHFIEPEDKFMNTFIENFNENFDCMVFDNNYIQYGDSDMKPLEKELICLKDVIKKENIIKSFKTGFFCLKDANNYFGITACRHSKFHKQNDDASYVLYIDKKPLFIDSGRYDYTKSEIRDHLCDWKGHNCLEIFGLNNNSNNFYGISDILYNEKNENHSIHMENKYYKKFNINHSRNIEINKDFSNVIFNDKITSANKISGCIYLNLSPHYKYFKDKKDSNIFYINSDYILNVTSDNNINISIEKGFYSEKTLHHYDIDTLKIEFQNINDICINVLVQKVIKKIDKYNYQRKDITELNQIDFNSDNYYSYKKINFLYKSKKQNKNLVVLFHGAVQSGAFILDKWNSEGDIYNSGTNRVAFRGFNYDFNNTDILSISDHLMSVYPRFKIGWFLSTINHDVESVYKEIIAAIIKSDRYTNIIFTGSSAGSYPALKYASFFKKTALILNPQIYLSKYGDTNGGCIKQGSGYYFLLKDVNSYNDRLIYDDKKLEQLIIKSTPQKIIYYQNKLDINHYDKQYLEFNKFIKSNKLDKIMESHIFSDKVDNISPHEVICPTNTNYRGIIKKFII